MDTPSEYSRDASPFGFKFNPDTAPGGKDHRETYAVEASDTNPKDLAGRMKPATFSVVPVAPMFQIGKVMSLGAAKYGAFNYRDKPISESVYLDAFMRHMAAVIDGQDVDPESGQSHVAHMAAGCIILLDAMNVGTLIRDLPRNGMSEKVLLGMAVPGTQVGVINT
ncbi:hypothetical protein EUV02_03850 [Polymorphobacter arshaanensis]|uniref:dATP/dGTP diphosphohydrolase N-terminal domain-containing protein n=1 Tax=Glacieibacterium arshaanense TaxID=2511025 RepID=A0A4Y9ER95_9SPHN|nr:dATP/dGTP diphosphohydrolase domain-containing protein [Polymorphobacter arshaanensis]TFU06156.1 hypothetical protein EUV02_03850 [Polymorphobacter arshaanensis]